MFQVIGLITAHAVVGGGDKEHFVAARELEEFGAETGVAHAFAVGDAPQLHFLVHATGEQFAATGMKHHAAYIFAVTGKGHQRFVGGQVKHLGSVIAAGGGEARAVVVPGYGVHPVRMQAEGVGDFAGGQIDYAHLSIGAAGDHALAGRIKGHIEHNIGSGGQHAIQLAGGRLKQTHLTEAPGLTAGGREPFAVRTGGETVGSLAFAGNAPLQFAIGRAPHGNFMVAGDKHGLAIGTEG